MSLIVALLLIAMALCIFISHERGRERLIKRLAELRRTKMTDRTINETECELCHRTIISGRMVEAHGGYVCEECCMGLVDGEMVTVVKENQNDRD